MPLSSCCCREWQARRVILLRKPNTPSPGLPHILVLQIRGKSMGTSVGGAPQPPRNHNLTHDEKQHLPYIVRAYAQRRSAIPHPAKTCAHPPVLHELSSKPSGHTHTHTLLGPHSVHQPLAGAGGSKHKHQATFDQQPRCNWSACPPHRSRNCPNGAHVAIPGRHPLPKASGRGLNTWGKLWRKHGMWHSFSGHEGIPVMVKTSHLSLYH